MSYNYLPQLVTITIGPKALSCAVITEQGKRAPLLLKNYLYHHFDALEIENLVLYNPTKIGTLISNFLKHHTLHNVYISIAFEGPLLQESFLKLPTTDPCKESFSIDEKKLIWNYCYLYPIDDHSFIFYVYTIAHWIILQYQLMIHTHNFSLLHIITGTTALLKLYIYFHKEAYRQAQLALDMIRLNNNVGQFFTENKKHRIIDACPTIINSEEKYRSLLIHCGQYINTKL